MRQGKEANPPNSLEFFFMPSWHVRIRTPTFILQRHLESIRDHICSWRCCELQMPLSFEDGFRSHFGRSTRAGPRQSWHWRHGQSAASARRPRPAVRAKRSSYRTCAFQRVGCTDIFALCRIFLKKKAGWRGKGKGREGKKGRGERTLLIHPQARAEGSPYAESRRGGGATCRAGFKPIARVVLRCSAAPLPCLSVCVGVGCCGGLSFDPARFLHRLCRPFSCSSSRPPFSLFLSGLGCCPHKSGVFSGRYFWTFAS